MLFVLFVSLALSETNSYQKAKSLYDRTDYASAIRVLESGDLRGGAELNLLGRAYFMAGEYKKATETFEKATRLEPNESDHWHWLGRTYGRRAEVSSFVTAPGYANKARQNFERAVELNPKNSEALGDLFEYYLQAPGFLGGGLDKAYGLVDRIAANDPAEKHYALARLAEHKKDFKTAEAQFRRSMELAPRQIGRIVDLARFLAKQGRIQESEQVFEHAKAVNPNHPSYLWNRAQLLVEEKRNLPEAKQLLEKYLSSSISPDDDHKDEARKLLAKVNGV